MVSRSCQASVVMAIYPHLIATWDLTHSVSASICHHATWPNSGQPAEMWHTCLVASLQRLKDAHSDLTWWQWCHLHWPFLSDLQGLVAVALAKLCNLLTKGPGSLWKAWRAESSLTTNRMKLSRKVRCTGERERPESFGEGNLKLTYLWISCCTVR